MPGKKMKQLVALVVTLAVLIVFYAWFSSHKDKEEKKEAEKGAPDRTQIYKVDSEDILSITYEYKDKKYTLEYNKDDEEWDIKGKENWPFKQDVVSAMLQHITDFESVADIDSDNFKEYGLDNPSKTVEVKSKKGEKTEKVKFLYGNTAPNAKGYYLTVEGTNKIYVVETNAYTAFEFDTVSSLEVETLDGISGSGICDIDVKSKDFTLKAKYDGNVVAGDGEWIVSKPYKKKQKGSSSMFSEYFVNYESLAFESEVVAYKTKNLKKYGLDKPQFEVKLKHYKQEKVKDNKDTEEDESAAITFSDKKKTFSLLVGKAAKTEIYEDEETILSYYVMKAGGDRVYTMEESMVKSLMDQTAFAFIDKIISPGDLLDYEHMKLMVDDDTYTFSKANKETKDDKGNATMKQVYKLDGKKVDGLEAEKVVTTLNELNYDGEISKKVKKDKLIATIKFKAKDEDTKDCTVKFLNYDDEYYRVVKDGEEQFVASKVSLENLINVIKDLKKLSQK